MSSVEPAAEPDRGAPGEDDTSLVVIFFDDMQGSTALKESMAERWDEQTFQRLRKEHDALLTSIITRDGAGEVIKSTGDGLLAIFYKPSTAVERAVEIQDRLHAHPHLSVRIGMDMGEVRVESNGAVKLDAFGRHVDWAARTMQMGDGGHICVTRSVYTDAFSWITKTRIAWKEHGPHRLKPVEPALEIFEPYNANIVQPMEGLRGEKIARPDQPPPVRTAVATAPQQLRLTRSWESVARDGRDFAERGKGMMYWFKVPLGGVCYPEGFRNFLQPALANPRISKIRFILDSSVPIFDQIWHELVLPLVQDWATQEHFEGRLEEHADGGRFTFGTLPRRTLAWALVNLAQEFTPCFKLLIHDPDTDEEVEPQAQIFLSTAARTVKFRDGTLQTVRIPDAVLRVSAQENDSLMYALNSVANQWDSLFT
ncbi:MAG TPA: adenylate/guanylate cyclase domain-containing protein [bacterium]|jgi:class 3 adenylate cyclase|nr:adenylate/guanylate cyclase domain-containing protein [bacterium]